MPTRPSPICKDCGLAQGCECDRRSPARRYRSSSAWTNESRRIIEAHVAAHGWWCPGAPELGHDPHPCTDLTTDHLDELVGSLPGGPRRVLCRVENGRRSATHQSGR
jgi:hypothetical protein